MGLFDFFKKDKKEEQALYVPSPVPRTADISEEKDIDIDKLLEGVNKYCPPRPAVKFKVKKENTSVFDSKIGGVPYFPKDMEYPRGKEGDFKDQPLTLLAQLNLTELPNIPDFPAEGILQFFISSDGAFGLSVAFESLNAEYNYRVIYHSEIVSDTDRLMSAEDIPQCSGGEQQYLPFYDEYKLVVEAAEDMPVTMTDYRSGAALIRSYNELSSNPVERPWEIGDEISDTLYDMSERNYPQAVMGGYPLFVQDDPRIGTGLEDYDTLLFGSDSIYDKENGITVSWGDAGTGMFLIRKEDLLARDFSKVLYNYDCA